MTRNNKVDFYKGTKNGKWYWRVVASNGRIIADSGQGYRTEASARKGWDSLCTSIMFGNIVESRRRA